VCSYGGICTLFCSNEDAQYKHPLMCEHGQQCTIRNVEHLLIFSHPKKKCNHGFNCKNLSFDHFKYNSHPFLPICRNGLLCEDKDEDHQERYTHACLNGLNCNKKDEFQSKE
jgi:hypothetical protein